MVIKSAVGVTDVHSFTEPEKGLVFIKNDSFNLSEPVILFLDINMPTLSGWEFMEQYEHLREEIKQNISVYIVSSSVDKDDKSKAEANPDIKGFLSKPLNREIILSIDC